MSPATLSFFTFLAWCALIFVIFSYGQLYIRVVRFVEKYPNPTLRQTIMLAPHLAFPSPLYLVLLVISIVWLIARYFIL